MALSYNKLWKKLIDLGINKTELRLETGITTNVLAKMGRNESVSLDNLEKICVYLKCELDDIVDIIPTPEQSSNEEYSLSESCIFDKDYNSLLEINWNFDGQSNDEFANIHPYPAKFINSIPKSLIEQLGCPDETAVMDPFCGCGTTLYESQAHGYQSVGIDLNPIACMISRIRTTDLSPSFENSYKMICKNLRTRSIPKERIDVDIPNVEHWFEPIVQNTIIALIEEINKQDDEKLRDELRFCLSSIMVRISNQESDTRYAAIQKLIDVSEVVSLFESACKKLSKVKNNYQSGPCAKVLNYNVLEIKKQQIKMKIGLVITSPPYPNAYEYWLYHKYRMWWLGYDPIHVRELEIGARPHYQKKNGQTEEDFKQQMNSVFDLFDEVVVKGGHVCIVVGRSIIKKKYVNNAQIIADLGEKHGYSFVANIVRDISSNRKSFNPSFAKINKENILVFRRI